MLLLFYIESLFKAMRYGTELKKKKDVIHR